MKPLTQSRERVLAVRRVEVAPSRDAVLPAVGGRAVAASKWVMLEVVVPARNKPMNTYHKSHELEQVFQVTSWHKFEVNLEIFSGNLEICSGRYLQYKGTVLCKVHLQVGVHSSK